MISNSISTSSKIHQLYIACPKLAEFCRSLFVLLVTHADDWGRVPGDELTVKMKVDPITPRKLPDFVAALHLLHEVGLINWYQVDGRKVIEIIKFADHQDLKGHDKTPHRQSKLPACPSPQAYIGRRPVGENFPQSSPEGEKRETTKGNLTEENLTEGKAGDERPQDELFREFQNRYPPSRTQGGHMVEFAFIHACKAIDGGYSALLAKLEEHKRSEQWLIAKRIPKMRTWFDDELWRQDLPPPENGNGNGNGHKSGAPRPKLPTVDEIRRANERPQ